jgi:hypothetical protein
MVLEERSNDRGSILGVESRRVSEEGEEEIDSDSCEECSLEEGSLVLGSLEECSWVDIG